MAPDEKWQGQAIGRDARVKQTRMVALQDL
jgi:hypothetical protein